MKSYVLANLLRDATNDLFESPDTPLCVADLFKIAEYIEMHGPDAPEKPETDKSSSSSELKLDYPRLNKYDLPAALSVNWYHIGQRLCLDLFAFDDEVGCLVPWCSITINIPEEPISDPSCCGFVDTNSAPYLIQFIEKNELGEPTGRQAKSGFCTYPEYRFNMQRVREHLIDG